MLSDASRAIAAIRGQRNFGAPQDLRLHVPVRARRKDQDLAWRCRWQYRSHPVELMVSPTGLVRRVFGPSIVTDGATLPFPSIGKPRMPHRRARRRRRCLACGARPGPTLPWPAGAAPGPAGTAAAQRPDAGGYGSERSKREKPLRQRTSKPAYQLSSPEKTRRPHLLIRARKRTFQKRSVTLLGE